MSNRFWIQEAQALRVRLRQVKPFDLNMPMVRAATISDQAQQAINRMLVEDRRKLSAKIDTFVGIVKGGKHLPAHQKQTAYALLKLQFNALLDRLDIFADALTQRSEHEIGIWLAGLDELAKDALMPEEGLLRPPPLICYLDRGHGAAIRRAKARLPGGTINPVAVIRIPRERMISNGIASSLVHEVGHQAASLLHLLPSLTDALQRQALQEPQHRALWEWYERWISEILSDFWGVATLGVGASTGLMNVVSLPSYFMFRLSKEVPHPPPWIRVLVSIAFGKALYADPQWDRLSHLWKQLYPLGATNEENAEIFQRLEKLLPKFVELVLHHRPKSLKGKMLKDIFPVRTRQPMRLRQLFQTWKKNPNEMLKKKPSLVFATLGQARADNKLMPNQEYESLVKVFRFWAMNK